MADENMQNQEGEQEGSEGGQERDYETEAKEMGWVDKDHYRDDESKWVDAKTFVERGEHILPIVQASNKKLRRDLLTKDHEVRTLQQGLDEARKAIKALQKSYTESTQREVERAKAELREQLVTAKESGDVRAEIEIQDKLDDLRQAEATVKQESQEQVDKGTPEFTPEYLAWQKENPWFGNIQDPEDKERTERTMEIGRELRRKGDTSTGTAFLNKCLTLLDEQETKGKQTPAQKGTSKVEGGSNGGRSTSARGFDSLSKEAKDICHEDNDRFVGPGKMFKTVKEWEDHYYSLIKEQE